MNRLVWLVMILASFAVIGCRSDSVHQRHVEGDSQALYQHAAVAADHPVASQAGLEMLKRGGNAVDAAVATSFCLSVVRPYSCGIGGGGFMLIFMPAKDGAEARSIAINYRETCPAAVGPEFYSQLSNKTASRFGHKAVGIPGTVAGLSHALRQYGTLSLATVLEPAIRAAEDGVFADANFVSASNELAKTLKEHPDQMENAAPIWQSLCKFGQVKVGDLIRQPQQARTLRLIAERGPDVFYKGAIAHGIFACMHAHDGTITMDDLHSYTVSEVEPLAGRVQIGGREYQLLSMPPPSSGGIAMQQIFGILQRREADLKSVHHTSASYAHLVAESMKHAFADRAEWLADPAFVDVPTQKLISPEYLDRLSARITTNGVLQPFDYGSIVSAEHPTPLDSGTSHLSVIDSSGMAVACTETINLTYGSLVTVPGFGFVLNNEMDDFTTDPGQPNAFGLRQSHRNLPQPGKRPLSSMSPTIVVQDGKAVLIAGASGGPRIITATTQCILNCLMFNMTPRQAVIEPRFHHQWMPNVLEIEKNWLDRSIFNDLKQRGHDVGDMKDSAQVQLIRVTDEGIRAASDPRKGGEPAGW